MTASDPFQAHLTRATTLFEAGDVMQAGQIWQAILKRKPEHRAAREGLYRVKLALEQRQAQKQAQEQAPVDCERLLREGCTLFDLGQTQDALQKWERILAIEPKHRLALAYANDARRDLGMALLPVPREEAEAAPVLSVADVDQLVREGVQLYDMGMAEEAMVKWNRALELNPEHKDAPKYLELARRERDQAASRPVAPRPAPRPVPRPAPRPAPVTELAAAAPAHPDGSLEARIGRAEQMIHDLRLEEALQAFQHLLDQGTQDPRIMAGYHQARALLNAQAAAHKSPTPVVELAPLPAVPAQPAAEPAGPPPALTERGPAHRAGLRLPGALRNLRVPDRLRTPRNLGLAVTAAALLLLSLILIALHYRETALREAVASAKINALRPVSRMVEVPSLPETLAAVQQEATTALPDDPLLAYFRGQEWQRRDPDNSAAVQLVQHAKDKLADLPVSTTLEEFDRALQAGNLEGARSTILALLRHDPDDLDLRGRCRKVLLALVPLYAGEDRMGKARDALCLGRALFPQDLGWQARLKLLDAIQAMSRSDRAAWVQLLG